jgi:hypothetical protein
MTLREFRDWQVFCVEHPLPFELTDIHGAMALAMMVNVNRAADSPMVDARDFLILKPRERPSTTPKPTMAQRMKAITQS